MNVLTNGNGRHARIMANAFLKFVYHSPQIDWSDQNLQQASNASITLVHFLKLSELVTCCLFYQVID